MKALKDESENTFQGDAKDGGTIKSVGGGGKQERVGGGSGDSVGGVKREGLGITLRGGKMPGAKQGEIVETMSLAEAYALILSKPSSSVKKVCVECKQEIVGTYAYTNQDHAICQPCARKRAGL